MTIKAVIFDMDGVLSDSMPAHATAWQKIFYEIGIHIDLIDIYLLEGSNHSGIIKIILDRNKRECSEEMISDLSSQKLKMFNSLYAPAIFDKVRTILSTLKSNGFRLAVASGSNSSTVHGIIDRCFDANTFEAVVTGDDVINCKPSPDAYLLAIDQLQLMPSECIVVENAPRGVAAAKRAGSFCIAITTTLDAQYLTCADIIVKDHRKLYWYLTEKLCLE